MEEERQEQCFWLPGHPSPSWGYLGLVLDVVLDLMKEGCAHRGIYSVRRDRGLRTEGDFEGPSLRCLPGWCLRLGERIKTGACFDWLPRA